MVKIWGFVLTLILPGVRDFLGGKCGGVLKDGGEREEEKKRVRVLEECGRL